MADPSTFAYNILKAIQERIELTKDAIVHGTAKDIEAYRELVGELRGLEFSEQEIKDYLEKEIE